jgi:hypothetical protein
MRVKRRLAAERLQRLRHRAHAAVAALSSARGERRQQPHLHDFAEAGTADPWADAPPGRRSARRFAVSAELAVRRTGSFSFQLPIDDVSSRGCKVELVEAVDSGDHVIARFPGLEPFSARVTWADTQHAGLQFERPLHPAVFDQLLTRLG